MVYVFLADGFEEIEALTVVDYLRRANIETQTVGINSKTITGAHSIIVTCDKVNNEIEFSDAVDAIVLPGGMPGTLNLEKSDTVQEFIKQCVNNKKFICAICAAPSILGHLGLLENKKAICFPGFEKDLKGAEIVNDYVAADDIFITAKGMGSAIHFSYEIVKNLLNENEAKRIKESIQCPF